MEDDRTLSLEQLENEVWEPSDFRSSLIEKCEKLRKKPIEQFDIEDLRVMISQQIGLPFLIPIALEKLKMSPLLEGNFYKGDLLIAVLQVKDHFWEQFPSYKDELDYLLLDIEHFIEIFQSARG
ncbi:contact-dependent growth inhibition system immunity protein [Risungbinella massiliensis]|uniref:contact-dependent growth inhibition system immunity protein n=1 Tax=Risungbinella massiliensis TaxID=1329796 RepID=UPI0005CBA4FF|nr:contact-dependent growth inhibition system immunity protein [Risungbinella massiliensis]